MKNILWLFILLISCTYEGYIENKIIEKERYYYTKNEITTTISYIDANGYYQIQKIFTGQYDYYRVYDDEDYKIILVKTIENKKGIKKRYKFYTNKKILII